MSNDNSLKSTGGSQTIGELLSCTKALMQKGEFAEVEKLMLPLLQENPNQEEGWYFLGVSQRYLKKYQAALDSLDNLRTINPSYGRAWQERGHVHIALGNILEARDAYLQAVAFNSALIASWEALKDLSCTDEDRTLHTKATDHHRRLSALPPELLGVRNMMAEGKLVKAEQLCRSFVQKNPKHVEGMRLLADLGVKSQVLDDAEFILESALVFEPDNRFARFDYMNVLYKRQKYEKSLEQAKILLESDPDSVRYKTSYANQSMAVGQFDEALRLYDEICERIPQDAYLHLMRGHTLKTIGSLNEAIQAYRAAYTARPDFGDAFWSLANLKTYRFTNDEIGMMRQYEEAPGTQLDDRIHLCFALGKSMEDRKDFVAAGDFYMRGNTLKKGELKYSAERMTQQLKLQKVVCTAELFESVAGSGHAAPDPIFIVGLPRSGSTLLEQILASHSMVDGTLELQNIPALAHRLGGRRTIHEESKYPKTLHELSVENAEKLGRAYIEETRIHRRKAPYFIDKMPNNFRHIGLIHRILPNAKIIDARRHPMACCFSGFKQLFAEGQEFTYGLEEIGRYYRDYVELMDHWDHVLPGRILRVQYEDVVADLDAQVRRILNFCSLPFEEGCINFYQTKRSVRTPSSEQVRKPIYTSGLEQWRNFEFCLDPLKKALGHVLERYPVPSEN